MGLDIGSESWKRFADIHMVCYRYAETKPESWRRQGRIRADPGQVRAMPGQVYSTLEGNDQGGPGVHKRQRDGSRGTSKAM